MAGSSDSSASSPLPSLSPSPRESASTSSSSSTALAPPPPPPPPPPPAKQRKKPGPKPKPKTPLTRIISLKINPDRLRAFPHSANGPQDSKTGTTPVSPPQPDASSPVNSDMNNVIPVLPSDRPKSTPGPKPGSKRGRQPGSQPGKPGRKRTKLDPNASPATHHSNHGKLGPKANQGAINAGLRALDRTGKPCKRWEKATISLKSFTGVQWSIPTWGAPVIDSSAPPTPFPGATPEIASAAPSVTSETPEIRIHPDMMNIDPPSHTFEQPYGLTV
ncbi:hypothetical protein Q9L58_006169 [Maublancomyces gigas]|uniref:Uncharacterized protein n=1 Tax=Discina gigas TaxID=1032678 RepID=A0ABR3GG11_9PEZI